MNETHPSIDQIVDFLHGESAAAEDAAIQAHLGLCPECDGRRIEETKLTEALRAHARATEKSFPPQLLGRIRAAVARPRLSSPRDWLRAFSGPVLLLPVAAAIAVVLYLGLNARHGSPAAINAAYYVNEHAALAAKEPFADDVLPATLTSDDEAR